MNTASFFDSYYRNAEVNSILILDRNGTVLDVNQSFTNNFGYAPEEIKGQNFKLLYTPKDKAENLPEIELATVLKTGQMHDENYVVDKAGNPVWCTGESILVDGENGQKFIVKDIINLQSKKQIQLFLKEEEELLEKIFESSRDIPMLILDGSMKIRRMNDPFLAVFEIESAPASGSRISEIDHPFWKSEETKAEISKIIVSQEAFRQKKVSFTNKSGQTTWLKINSKLIDKHSSTGKKVFLILEDITAEEEQARNA